MFCGNKINYPEQKLSNSEEIESRHRAANFKYKIEQSLKCIDNESIKLQSYESRIQENTAILDAMFRSINDGKS
jgi:hypothetical protein